VNLVVVVAILACPVFQVPIQVWQVAPDARGRTGLPATVVAHDRAVVLIPGLKIHPLRPVLATRPELHNFQQPSSPLVRTLAKDFDVFALGYAQTMPVEVIPHAPGLRQAIAQLRQAGYKEIVLMGHSAGGVIARLFVTAYPNSGVTKVISVASPHRGSQLADILRAGYPKIQAPFVESLATEPRATQTVCQLPEQIEMACVVCKLPRLDWDGLVHLSSAWPEDCQKCGIPVVLLPVSHWEAMHGEANARVLAELARERLTRWSPEQVEQARKILLQDERRGVFRRR
jgi:hypothetical protein